MHVNKHKSGYRLMTEGSKVYLDGIPLLDWGTGEMCEFASTFTRMFACLGEDVPYHTVMGVTGVAFRFTFGPEHWNPGYYAFAGVADERELFRRAFAAVGYGYHYHESGDTREDLQRIRDTIDRGIAVMLKGNVVDCSDWVLITGYDTGSDVLFGSSTYSPVGTGERFNGYDVIREWHDRTRGYLLPGAKGAPLPPRDRYIEALQLAVRLARTPPANRYAGLNAYDSLTVVLRATDYTEETRDWRYLCLLCYEMMLDDHKSAAPFLRDAAQVLPDSTDDLTQAAACYEHSGTLRDSLDTLLPGDFSPAAQQRLLDPAVREEFARVLLAIRDVEEDGICHIAQALHSGHG